MTLDASNFLLRFEELELVMVPSLAVGRDPETLLAQRANHGAALQGRQPATFRGSPKYRVDVIESRHAASFTNTCEHTLVELAAGKTTQTTGDATLALFECYVSTAIAPAEAHRLVTAYVVSFLDKIAEHLDATMERQALCTCCSPGGRRGTSLASA